MAEDPTARPAAGRAALAQLVLRAAELAAVLGAIALLCGMLVVLADVLTRRTLGSPLRGVNDLVQLAVIGSACLALPLAFARGSHVAVEFLTRRLPPPLQRALSWLVAAAEAGFLLMLFLFGLQQARLRLAMGDVSPTLGLPVAVYWLPYLLGIGLALPAVAAGLADRLAASPRRDSPVGAEP